MRRIGALLLGLAALLATSGCQSSIQLTPGSPTPEALSCARTGGFLDKRGRRGDLMCVHAFGDAGKACSAKKDCQGRCLAATDGTLPKVGEEARGICQADNKLFGCFAEVEYGKVKSSMCID
ncbi:MAG TPA: hypothetical protein VFF84_02060 [Sphingobium sp.]|nr:hypothetical protein [Sphingobium sp.]